MRKPIRFEVFADGAGTWRFRIITNSGRSKPVTSAPFCDMHIADRAARACRDALRDRERTSVIVSPKEFKVL